ncbi:hypothetical protein ACGE24_06495 [Corynebacterium kroppenstedtii]|uniref:hypothetical protein n=1 Tax=Corynebacterium sp. PCR 32 TaxID=3351342 RepID=UPI0030B1F070
MIKLMVIFGSFVLIVASVLALISGQYLVAAVAALISIWGFQSLTRHSAFDEIAESGVPAPPVDDLKQFRHEHPELSFSESIVALQSRSKRDHP